MFCLNCCSSQSVLHACSFESNIGYALTPSAWFDNAMNRAGALAIDGAKAVTRLALNVSGLAVTYGTLALATLSIPIVYHAQFHDQFQAMTTWDRKPYGLCEFVPPKSQLVCAVASRTVFRVMDFQNHNPAACVQSSRVKKFIFNRGEKGQSRQENWDKTMLALCIRRNQNSPDPIRNIKVTFCSKMLETHKQIDRLCK